MFNIAFLTNLEIETLEIMHYAVNEVFTILHSLLALHAI